MNILYFDCMSGVSGDMIVGAFLDMGIAPEALARELGKVSLGAVYDIEAEKVDKNGVSATAFSVYAKESEKCYLLSEVATAVKESALADKTKKTALRIFKGFAEGHSRVHGSEPERACLFGADAVRSLVNIIAAAECINMLGADYIVSSPLVEGSGYVNTHSGLMRVPVPAVMEILRFSAAPVEICSEKTQLITPTGAAIVCGVAQRFDEMPSMTVSAIGFGAGRKDLNSRANVLRAVLGRNEYRFFEENVCIIDTENQYSSGFLTSCK